MIFAVSKELCSSVFWTDWMSSFNIEFAVMLFTMSHKVVGVSSTELVRAKVCQVELGQPESVCSHLRDHSDILSAVLARVNMFEATGDLMSLVPALIYALLAGAISDRFGRKPLMVMVESLRRITVRGIIS